MDDLKNMQDQILDCNVQVLLSDLVHVTLNWRRYLVGSVHQRLDRSTNNWNVIPALAFLFYGPSSPKRFRSCQAP